MTSTGSPVAIICSSMVWGGTEKWAMETVRLLRRRGHQALFLVRNPSLWRDRGMAVSEFSVLPFRNDADVITLVQLYRIFRRFKPVVIPTRVRDYFLAGIAARLARVPVLLRLGIVRHLRENYWKDRLRYGSMPDAVLVNAEAIRNVLYETSWMRSTPVHVIRNGVDLHNPLSSKQRNAIRTKLGLETENILFIGIGRLSVQKRWHWLIDAVDEMTRDGMDVSAAIIGAGKERSDLEQRIQKLKLQERIKLTGYVEDVKPWYQAADVAVLPSTNEGVSNAMLEAMSYHVPAIVTSSGGVEEIFQPNRDLLLSSRHDFPGFFDHCRQLAKDRSLRQFIASNAYKTIQGEFSWDRMADQLEQVLQQMSDRD